MAYLVLSNGKVFEGKRIGADCQNVGRLVFNTNVIGYVETLTDPSNADNIVVQTFPLIGNYGVNEADIQSDFCAKGLIIRELCESPSNFRSEGTLDDFLKKKGIPALCGIDTRELTRLIRDQGELIAVITDTVPEDISSLTSTFSPTSALPSGDIRKFPADSEKKYSVALIDCGAKQSLISALTSRGCEVTLVPFDKLQAIASMEIDGMVISDGAADPVLLTENLCQLKSILGKVPTLGVGLGHQLIALCMGGALIEMEHSHRGSNQPISGCDTDRTYISAQNHRLAVDAATLGTLAAEFLKNTNDGTNEGLYYPSLNCISIQFTPADSGRTSTAFIYDRFIKMMGGESHA